MPPLYLGFDPGQDKCGLAIVPSQGAVQWHEVVETPAVLEKVAQLCQDFAITQVILGNQTRSQYWKKRLEEVLPEAIAIALVDERYSSLEARQRYWKLYPPKLWQRLIPQGMRQPPRPVDDLVAIILVERFLAENPGSAAESPAP